MNWTKFIHVTHKSADKNNFNLATNFDFFKRETTLKTQNKLLVNYKLIN